MNTRLAAVLLILILALTIKPARSQSTGDILGDFARLENCGSVLYVAAHPDDENNRLLSWLGRGKYLRTGYLALNRGEGGQNLIGSQQGDALGLVRSRELMGARSVDGARQFFTRAYDFGFSKSPQETFSHWSRDSILSDMVWVIRRFRPDVVINRFPTTGEGGHGHHTASAILSLEAVKAAADPTRFTEQLAYVQTWKVKSIFWNTFNFGGISTQREDQMKLDVGGYNPIIGKSYGELAAESRSFHKSQGFGSEARRGTQIEYFKMLVGAEGQKTLLDSVNLGWGRIKGGAASHALLEKARLAFDVQKPAAIIPLLALAWQKMDAIQDHFWKEQKREELRALIKDCLGLYISAEAPQADYAIGASIPVSLHCIIRNLTRVELSSIAWNGQTKTLDQALTFNVLHDEQIVFKTDSSMLSQPYWLKLPHTRDSYSGESDPHQRGLPKTNEMTFVTLAFKIEGAVIAWDEVIINRSVEPSRGEQRTQLRVLPALSLNPEPAQILWTGSSTITAGLRLVCFADSVNTRLQVELPEGVTLQTPLPPVKLAKGGSQTLSLKLSLDPRLQLAPAQAFSIFFSAKTGSQTNHLGIHELYFEHTGELTWFDDSRLTIIPVPLKVHALSIGYVDGAGDQVPSVLRQLGYRVTLLDDDAILHSNLKEYHAIILGVRALNVRKVLARAHDRLLAYMASGHTLIVQYNNPNNLQTPIPAPYPLTPGGERVTDEHAPVGVLLPQEAVLNVPNKIGAGDFQGWIQERGLYYPDAHDSHYREVLVMQEEGTRALKTGILYCPFKGGNYYYTSLSFFRQLPAGVPGAIRLFVNMIESPLHAHGN